MTEVISQSQPTMYFFGVTTGKSSSRKMFPHWAKILGLEDAQLVGVDIPINAPPEVYRRAVLQIKEDPLSLGTLVTTHKINVLRAARKLLDELTPDADLCGEVSSIYKREGRLIGHAVDPVNSGEALYHFLGRRYFQKQPTDIMCLGAGGSAIALITHFCTRTEPTQRPQRMVVVNRSQAKLDNLRNLLKRLPKTEIDFELMQNSDPTLNDQVMATLPPYSIIINATGMGKDIPGSPITEAGRFPLNGVAWELNYRGELDFLQQAKAQRAERGLIVEDGWYYFLIGWASVMSNIFNIEIGEAQFLQLKKAAETIRG